MENLTKTKTTHHHYLLAKIRIKNKNAKDGYHNDPSRGYEHFAQDIKDLINEDINPEEDCIPTVTDVQVIQGARDDYDLDVHYAYINVQTHYLEDSDDVCGVIQDILENRLPELLQELIEIKPRQLTQFDFDIKLDVERVELRPTLTDHNLFIKDINKMLTHRLGSHPKVMSDLVGTRFQVSKGDTCFLRIQVQHCNGSWAKSRELTKLLEDILNEELIAIEAVLISVDFVSKGKVN